MTLQTRQYTGAIVITTCWCGIRHGVPQELYDHQNRAHRDGGKQRGIYCPLGHEWIFSGKGEAAKLRDQLASTNAQLAQEQARADHNEARRVAQKAATTKARKRHAAGVCPACNRSFKQLREHMARMHPDYDPSADVPRGPKGKAA